MESAARYFTLSLLLGCALGVQNRARGKSPPAAATPTEPSEAAVRAAFEKWKTEHGVSFASAEEEEADLRQWAENDASIRSHNAAGTGFELGHNAYSGYSWGQFQTLMSIGSLPDRRAHREVPPVGVHAPGDYNGNLEKLRDATRGPEARARAAAEAALKHSGNGREWASVARSDKPHRMSLALGNRNPNVPEERDWVAEGGVSKVYDQGSCGSCWSFAATGAVEGLYFATTGQLIPLSQQNLLACDYGPQAGHYHNYGCRGGLPDTAFAWVARNGGLCAYVDYPYISGNGRQYRCRPPCEPVVTIGGYNDVTPNDELALMDAVAQQPVAVAIDAEEYAFMFYKSGVLDTAKCGDSLNHAVLVVGYGTDALSGKAYWKVKNSWGPSWGEGGYVRLARGKNMCGVAAMPSYPLLAMRAPHLVQTADLGQIACNKPLDGDARLTAYPNGNLLVYSAGQWRTVCADTSSRSTAQLACSLLGYSGATTMSNKAAPGGPYNISNGLQCRGTENALDECRRLPIQKGDWCADYPAEMAAYIKCYGLPDGASTIAAGAALCGTSGWSGRSFASLLAEAAPQRAAARAARSGDGGGVTTRAGRALDAAFARPGLLAMALAAVALAAATVIGVGVRVKGIPSRASARRPDARSAGRQPAAAASRPPLL